MLTLDLIRPAFGAGLSYDAYVAAGTPDQRERWDAFHRRVRLSDPQRSLIAGFSRRINVLVVSGLWCGDCVQQCPMLDHIAKANPAPPGSPPGSTGIDLRFVDRDEHRALSDAVRICGGNRVPTALFLNEDLEFVSLMGDKSLARFRALAAKQLGPSCPLPGAPVPDDEVAATLTDWVNEFERVALLLRLSAKLRERHGD
ncbi:MAG: thioredoxin family protein [Phycisphaeraceae bacterium]|nr:MAG: thioredoxin family protein [Phycisphaeraceae bacterium]